MAIRQAHLGIIKQHRTRLKGPAMGEILMLHCFPHTILNTQYDSCHRRAKTILINIADLSIQQHHYSDARKHYETLAADSVDNSTLRFSVPKYLLNGVLCTVAEGDWVKARKVLEGYGERYVAFAGGTEFGALQVGFFKSR